MIKFIEIHNFAKINHLVLASLTQVNYLVGTSVSGKSSTLLAIYEYFSKLSLGPLELESSKKEDYNFKIKAYNHQIPNQASVLFINQNSTVISKSLEKFIKVSLDDSSITNQTDFFPIFLQELQEKYNYYDWGFLNSNYAGYSSELDRIRQIETNLEKLIKKHFYENGDLPQNPKIVLLEEPENYFHPSLVKQLPRLFKALSDKYQIQFVIATNSPFLLLASGDLTEDERIECECRHKEFFPSQKIYLLENGKNITKSGRFGIVKNHFVLGSDGYWGKKIGFVASKILGSSLSDFIRSTEQTLDENAGYLVLCEGQGQDEDAKIYNQIFWDYIPRVLFVSCRGNTQAAFSFEILEQVKNGLYANFQVLMLRDRDHEFPKNQDILDYRQNSPHRRVLFKRSIEGYVFASEIFKKWLEVKKFEIEDSKLNELVTIEQEIADSVQQGILGNFYKEKYKTYFSSILFEYNKDKLNQSISFEDFKWQMIALISPKTKTYNELKKSIF